MNSSPNERDAEQTVNAVIEAINTRDFARAHALADAGIKRGIQQPALHNARALWLSEQGRHQEALIDFEQARAYFPRDPMLLNAVGLCLFHLRRMDQAIQAFNAAIASAPDFARAHYGLARVLGATGDIEAAQQALERATEIDPNDLDILTGLAAVLLRTNRRVEARALVERVQVLEPSHSAPSILLSMIDMEEKNFVAVEERLSARLQDPSFPRESRAAAVALLAEGYDKQGFIDKAFTAYVTLNEELRRVHASDYAVGRALENVIGLTAYFERSAPWPALKPLPAKADAAASQAFLLGFMRSGTTLLESVLASSPKVAALDEQDFLREPARIFLGSDEGLDKLARIGDPERTRWCEDYWRSIRQQRIPVAGKLFLDKLPFNSVKLPLIAKLFPDAKIIFAIRDPRDVVLSAFRNRFVIHADTFEFLRLDDCARYYAAVMRFVEICREKLPLQVYEHRYENLVQDFDGSMKAICAFLDIEWSESMRKFEEGPRVVDLRSVSALQVQRGLYQGGAGQWRKYEKQMAPVLPILQPWVEKFGYPA